MNKRRIPALALVLAMLLALLAGCGTTEPAAESPTAETPVAESAQPEETAAAESVEPAPSEPAEAHPLIAFPLDEEVTLSAWTMWIPGIEVYLSDTDENVAYNALHEKTNVKIDFSMVSSPETASQEFNLLIASGDYPDMFNNFGMYYTNGFDHAIDEEIIVPLNDYLDYMPNFNKLIEENNMLDTLSTDSGNIGAALQIIDPEIGNLTGEGLVIRQELLDELGLAVPQTYDELTDALVAIKDSTGMTNAMYIPRSGLPGQLFAYYGLSVDFNNERGSAPWNIIDNQISFSCLEDDYYNILDQMSRWNKLGLFDSDYLNNNYNADASDISKGTAALYQTGLSQINTINNSDTGITLKAMAAPVQAAGEKITAAKQEDVLVEGTQGYTITTACETPDIAAAWLDYMYGDEGAVICNYGVEGVTFDYDETGKPVVYDLITSNPDIPMAYAQFVYVVVTGTFKVDKLRFNSDFCPEAAEAKDIWDSVYSYEGEAITLDDLELTADETSEYTQTFSDIATYCTEAIAKFIIGDEELTQQSFDSFRDQLTSMGIDDCAAIYQTALDRYLAK